jgi:hypothetical protein
MAIPSWKQMLSGVLGFSGTGAQELRIDIGEARLAAAIPAAEPIIKLRLFILML